MRFITASDLPGIYSDAVRGSGATEAELGELAQRILAGTNGLDFQRLGGKSFSAADQFELLTLAVGRFAEGRKLKFPLATRGLLGPDGTAPTNDRPITPSTCKNPSSERNAVTVNFAAPRDCPGQRATTNAVTSAATKPLRSSSPPPVSRPARNGRTACT